MPTPDHELDYPEREGDSAAENQQLPYRDLQLNGLTGYPEIIALDANTLFVSDWNGVIRKVDWIAGTVEISSSAGLDYAGRTLRSLCATKGANLIGVATTAIWAAIWDMNTGSMDKAQSKIDSSVNSVTFSECVNSVTFSPTGEFLVLGTGYYPLDPSRRVEAGIEVWSHEEDWKLEMAAALPGVCVDWLGWHDTSNTIVALTGRRSQDGGFISFLDGNTLRPRRVVDRNDTFVHVCGMQDYPLAVAVYGERGKDLTVVHLEESGEYDWRCMPETNLMGGCLDGQEILTTSGHFVDFETGKINGELAPLNDCCRVALRPGGGYLGIATNGTLRVWEELS